MSGYQLLSNSKAQPPGRQMGALNAPVPGLENLVGQEPGRGLGQGRVPGGNPRGGQGPERQPRVPHRGDAGLEAHDGRRTSG